MGEDDVDTSGVVVLVVDTSCVVVVDTSGVVDEQLQTVVVASELYIKQMQLHQIVTKLFKMIIYVYETKIINWREIHPCEFWLNLI